MRNRLQLHMFDDLIDPIEENPAEMKKVLTPSAYQQAIYDFQETGSGDCFVNAVAGSGKTTSLVELSNRLPERDRRNACFVAFNKHIVKELETRLPEGFTVRTIHSLGFQALRRKHRYEGEPVDEQKYRKLAASFVADYLADNPECPFGRNELRDAITEATSKVRLTLTQPKDPFYNPSAISDPLFDSEGKADPLMREYSPLWSICNRFEIEVLDRKATAEGVERLLTLGREMGNRSIDIDDMVWLAATDPEVRPWYYGTLYVDEAQDLNAAQREFCLKIRGGRATWVGDKNQAIYGFAGADYRSFDAIKEATGACELPLSICYRCPSSHIDLARKIVPQIEARPGAPEGKIEYVGYHTLTKRLGHGEMVLCRMTQPLIELCFDLINSGLPATVKGRDIGKQITGLLDTVSRLKGYKYEDLEDHLETYCMQRIALLAKKEQENAIQALQDRWHCLALINQRCRANAGVTESDLREIIEDLFSDKEGQLVTLSTVHKAKGLEADTVYLLDPDLLNGARAKTTDQMQQEMNLKYVALTRAKTILCFIGR